MDTVSTRLLYEETAHHRLEHRCGGVPYEYGDILTVLVTAINARKILEVGTALGYTTVCLAKGSAACHLDTIDQDQSHLQIAQTNFERWNVSNQIAIHHGKAEGILKTLEPPYDLIFFDGYVPQVKMLLEFERLLKRDGMLVTANLFLRDEKGGRYVQRLQDKQRWQTGIFADTALSVKRF